MYGVDLPVHKKCRAFWLYNNSGNVFARSDYTSAWNSTYKWCMELINTTESPPTVINAATNPQSLDTDIQRLFQRCHHRSFPIYGTMNKKALFENRTTVATPKKALCIGNQRLWNNRLSWRVSITLSAIHYGGGCRSKSFMHCIRVYGPGICSIRLSRGGGWSRRPV